MVRSVTCDVLSSRRPSVLTFLSVKTAEAQGMIRLRKYIFQNYLVIEVTIEADSAASSIFPWLSTLHGPHSCRWACKNQHQKVWSQECDSLKHRPRFDFCGIFPLPLNNSRENSVTSGRGSPRHSESWIKIEWRDWSECDCEKLKLS